LIDHLNNVKGVDGWFTKIYGGIDDSGLSTQPDGLKKLWQVHNTQKLDGIRTEIDFLNLDETTKAVALSSLILALDKVDSTMGHFVSYLRDWSPRSYGQLKLEIPMLWKNEIDHSVTREDVLNETYLRNTYADLAYFDPPYGSNNEKMPPSRVRYQSYYHVWTTVVKNDMPEVFGAAARRLDSSDTIASSVFEEFRRNDKTGRFIAVDALDRLLAQTQARYIMLSYSSDGRATASEVDEVLRANGKLLSTAIIDYKRNVMAGMVWTNQWLREVQSKNQEFIFLLEK
jgi:adenine-specific DNA-methyltransferase